MPRRLSPAKETGGDIMTPATSNPPLTQPLSDPRQVSTQSVAPSETTRPTTPPSREGGTTTFTSPITKTPDGWEALQRTDDLEELKNHSLATDFGSLSTTIRKQCEAGNTN